MNSSFSSRTAAGPQGSIIADKKLGSGRFQVYHATIPFLNKEYALKIFPKDPSSETSYQREKEILSSFCHKNVVKHASGVQLTGLENFKSSFILMEYAPYGTFFDLIINKGLVDEKLLRTYFRQLIEGIEHIHSNRISHGDLKLENLLLGKDFLLKITDFDQSQRSDEKNAQFKGTACYRAPEVLEGSREDFYAADIFSAGVILFAFKARVFPFVEKHGEGTHLVHYDLFMQQNETFWKVKASKNRNEDFFSPSFRQLVNGMLERDPKKRLTIRGIKGSKWYNEPVYSESEVKEKMERMWERIMFKKSLKRGKSLNC